MTIGLNGGYGFIGYHLWVYLHYKCKLNIIRLSKDLSNDLDNLQKCDVVIHLAEKNRGDDQELYSNNIESTNTLIKYLTQLDIQPLIIYTSSIHENSSTLQGEWRRQNKKTFSEWALNGNFISLALPNIFGPFCKPNYNSFIATLCYSIINDKKIEVNDNSISLLYVDNLCKQIYEVIQGQRISLEIDLEIPLKDIKNLLLSFKEDYINKGIIPKVDTEFALNLFTAFRSYIQDDQRLFSTKHNSDDRGNLSELVVSREKGQIFYSTTNPGYTRGNHFHTKRIERFCILKGTAQVNIRKIGSSETISYIIKDTDYKVIDMPPYYTHNLINIGENELVACFWMNDLLSEQEIDDTYFEIV